MGLSCMTDVGSFAGGIWIVLKQRRTEWKEHWIFWR